MKILVLNYEFPPLGGGAGNATYYFLKELLKDKSLDITLVTSSLDKQKEEDFASNVKIYYLDIGKKGNIHYQSQKDLLAYDWKAYWFCRKLKKQKEFHLIHAFFGIPCGFIAMLLGLPYIVSLRGSDVPFYNKRFYWLDELVFKKLSKKIWRKAKRVVALSNDLVNLSRKTSLDQEMGIIYNGVNTEEFFPNKNILSEEETFNILFVGRLIERKGLIYLLDAFKDIITNYPNIRLTVVGDGPLKNQHVRYVQESGLENKIEFLGAVKHSDMPIIYQKAHLFVLPSLNEALGNVTQEALASGLPIITTKTGAAELIKDNGFIVSKSNSQDIKETIVKYLENSELTRNHGLQSRQLAKTMSWERVAESYKNAYKLVHKNDKKVI